MYSACILWVMSPEIKHSELHWRMMLVMAAILPAALGILSYFFLLESPHWLLAQQRYSDAKAIILIMAEYKGTVPKPLMEDFTRSIHTPAAGSPVLQIRDFPRELEPLPSPGGSSTSLSAFSDETQLWT